nr:hypothetical protein [Prevotella sp.]
MSENIIGEKASKVGKGCLLGNETFYEKIEYYYGRERIVPTIMLLLAAKSVGVVEGDILSNVEIRYKGKTLCTYNGEIVKRKIESEDYFSVDVEEYALCSGEIHLKWKDSKQMLAIFANMCIGGGLWVRRDTKGKPFIGYDDNSSLTFRDIWSDVFGFKSDLRNTYYKVCCDRVEPSHIKILEAIQDKAEAYYGIYRMIQERWKVITELQKRYKEDF